MATRGHSAVEEKRQLRGDEARAPVILADGTRRYFRYELDTDTPTDWEETDRDDMPVWEDDDAVHWIDTTVRDPDSNRPSLDITIYQEVVFTADCDGSGIAHPGLSPAEWERQDSVSNADLDSWLVLWAADEVQVAFDHVIWQLAGGTVDTPAEKYGVTATETDIFYGETYPGTCRIRLVGIDPQQIVKAGQGPLPAARNGSVLFQLPAISASDWSRVFRSADPSQTKHPHLFVRSWKQVLTEPIAVELAPRRRFDMLFDRDECGSE
ncbi:hypothetical protein [Haladaptatus sp. NG-SE-30]